MSGQVSFISCFAIYGTYVLLVDLFELLIQIDVILSLKLSIHSADVIRQFF